jgi:general stress protein 26
METTVCGDMDTLARLIRDVRVAMLVTRGSQGPHARPMYTQKIEDARTGAGFDGTLWFMTDAGSAKVTELLADPAVMVIYSAPDKNRFVAVYGAAAPETNPDKARELWNIHTQGWWPGGPDEPGLVLLRVRVERAEYWEGPSNAAYMLRLLRAVAVGERVDVKSEHGTVEAGDPDDSTPRARTRSLRDD